MPGRTYKLEVPGLPEDCRSLAQDMKNGKTSFVHAINALLKKYGAVVRAGGSRDARKFIYNRLSKVYYEIYGVRPYVTGPKGPRKPIRSKVRRSMRRGKRKYPIESPLEDGMVNIVTRVPLSEKRGGESVVEFGTNVYDVKIIIKRLIG